MTKKKKSKAKKSVRKKATKKKSAPRAKKAKKKTTRSKKTQTVKKQSPSRKKLASKMKARPSKPKGAILLEDGTFIQGYSFGARGTQTGEFVFHTSPTGYQEILTDPSYHRQVIAFSHPQLGNQGFHSEDFESEKIWAAGCVVRDYSEAPYHWRKKSSLDEVLREQQTPGLYGLDTRRLILRLRDKGCLWGVISSDTDDREELARSLKDKMSMEGQALAYEVSTKTSYTWVTGSLPLLPKKIHARRGLRRCVVLDFGVKRQILRYLIDSGFEEVVVVPAKTRASEIRALAPDALFLSNGPGDPAAVKEVIEELKLLIGEFPMFGICLGHQILALSLGLKTYKLKFGHHAANHPVKNLLTGQVEITSQNHGFAVEMPSGESPIEVTHINMNDDTVAGFRHKQFPLCGIQFHPESSPGPLDSQFIFESFQQGFKAA